jgi:hypothetical protein
MGARKIKGAGIGVAAVRRLPEELRVPLGGTLGIGVGIRKSPPQPTRLIVTGWADEASMEVPIAIPLRKARKNTAVEEVLQMIRLELEKGGSERN